MLSPRTRAHVGLFAAAMVLVSSMAVLLMGHEPQPQQTALEPTAPQSQVVIGDSPTFLTQR
jgi:hypothetical protein